MSEFPEVAFRLGFHLMSRQEMGSRGRELLEALPHPKFAEMQAGRTYLVRHGIGAGGRDVVFRVKVMTPSKTQAVVTHPPAYDKEYRMRASQFNVAEITELDAVMEAFVGKTHADVVAAAKEAGLYADGAPLAVRIEYPQLFADIPERFAKTNETPSQRVSRLLCPMWGQPGLGPKRVRELIEAAHRYIAQLTCWRTQRAALNPDTTGDYDRVIQEHLADIDFYRWLLPLVSEGGVFCAGGEASRDA